VKNPKTQVARSINTINITLDSSLQTIEKLFLDRKANTTNQSYENEFASLNRTYPCDNKPRGRIESTQQEKIQNIEYRL